MTSKDILLQVKDLKKYFPINEGLFKKVVGHVKAIDGVSFSIKKGETVGLVGESGCGKTTTGRCILQLLKPTNGVINFKTNEGIKDLTKLNDNEMKEIRKEMQIIFQDPFSSLDPRMTVRQLIEEPLKIHQIGNRKNRIQRVEELLEKVGLSAYHMERHPHEFSGGQRQRIAVARALSLNPKLIICDEPVSALDVSIQAQVLNLLSKLQEEHDFTYLFIAHDLSVVEHISDRVMVMYLGKIVETATSDRIYQNPKHPYTEAILSAINDPEAKSTNKKIILEGSVPDPSNPPSGCNFHTRCPYAEEICSKEEPELVSLDDYPEHYVSCHFKDKLKLQGFKLNSISVS